MNPFEGCVPSVPEGEKLDWGSPHFRELERAGVAAAGGCAFVLVAGGLGERLGYSGIKVGREARCWGEREESCEVWSSLACW